MPNMSYCRFQNTLRDLEDCAEHMTDDVSEREAEARRELVKVARHIVDVADGMDE